MAAGEIKGFTGVDDPYEAPLHADIVIKNNDLTVQQSVDIILHKLRREGVLVGAPTLPNGLPYPDGDEIINLHLSKEIANSKLKYIHLLPKVLLSDIDVNWLQTIAEGWAAPLKGFMREGTLLQTIHFSSIITDPYNLTGLKSLHETKTNFQNYQSVSPPKRVSMSVPIVLPITDFTKDSIEYYLNDKNNKNHDNNNKEDIKREVALYSKFGEPLGILKDPEIYKNRKEEIVTRVFGVIDFKHPYIQHIYAGGDWLLGGEIELFDRIKYNDGLDKWRLTAIEVMEEFKKRKADAVFAFQTRNPTHAGHAYLMKTSRDMLLQRGYNNPILLLSPLGGWTKEDDVPLDVRVTQHEAILNEHMLDPETTVMAIWPAPMLYAGPTEVIFHAKSRRNAGATFFVAGRDPAGMKGSDEAYAHPNDDLYDGDHGRYVLVMSPGQQPMEILPFGKVYYDKRDHVMKDMDLSRPNDFIEISGSKMRALAKAGATPCDVSHGKEIPSDLLKENCVPPGFMVQTGWDIVCKYYQNVQSSEWVPYSVQNFIPTVARDTKAIGKFGTSNYELFITTSQNTETKENDKDKSSEGIISPWHDIPLHASKLTYNMVIEIPMYSTAKMEVTKGRKHNPIKQDLKDTVPRYYRYGVPFFNYGMLPQTWESNRKEKDEKDNSNNNNNDLIGDNDPVDVIEVGGGALAMGQVVEVKIIGGFELVDEGELDYKIIALRTDYVHIERINSLSDLEHYQPQISQNLMKWFINYKLSEGKGKNKLLSDIPLNAEEALNIIHKTNEQYKRLVSGVIANEDGFYLPPKDVEVSRY